MSTEKHDTYWTVGAGTRHEARVRRCGVCGNSMCYRVGSRPGPCPYREIHKRIEAAKA